MPNEKMRILYLDIAKGLGILFVVWAHAKGPYSSYMYQFHMPLFFLISGYLYHSDKPFRRFLKDKVKALYIPFILWNGLAVIIKTVLAPGKLINNIKVGLQVLLLLNKDGQFFGATWFLGALFMVSVLYKVLDVYIQECKYKHLFLWSCFTALAIIGFEMDLPFMLSRTLILGLFYAAGHFVKIHKDDLTAFNRPLIAVLAFVVFIIIGHYNAVNMGANTYRYYFAFIFGAVCASYSTIFVAARIEEAKESKVTGVLISFLCCLGRNSIDIVIWQFVAFRLVIAFQLYLEQIPFNQLLKYYPVYSASGYWWLIYMVIGLLAPIFLGIILRYLKRVLIRYGRAVGECYR